MPLTIDLVRHVKDTGGVSLGVANQLSINEKGECYTKICATHVCSFPVPPDLSVNNIVLINTM